MSYICILLDGIMLRDLLKQVKKKYGDVIVFVSRRRGYT